ncbi:hypothetical protein CTEN210_18439 [Chaetoceros tenuissimus]|uniref:Uncharacterized protein n=1 Tax=Chaetoceros tenuissimus TaxID=426638 RepID=A0AAD3DCN3_9STRA|nr:hypothetical protein CTEN210_18439 [Chaetoceros tenuissimus]
MSDTVERIEKGAFTGCGSLEYIKFSRNLQRIEREAFLSCRSLTSVVIPPSCKEIGKSAFEDCHELIILSVPEDTQLGEYMIVNTALIIASPFETNEYGRYENNEEVNNWIKYRLNEYPLHKVRTPDLYFYKDSDWYQKDDCSLTPIDYFIANFGTEHVWNLPQYAQYLIKNKKLHELKKLSTEKIIESQLAWQQKQITSLQSQIIEQQKQITTLQSQITEQNNEITSFQKDRYHFMSVKLLEDEIKCLIRFNKFSTDIASNDHDIRKFLPVLSQKCHHYVCQGCMIKTQQATAENAPRVPKWLKCMFCQRKTAFCPENPFYHTKLIQLLERARRCHPTDVKVKVEIEDTSLTSNMERPSKRPKRPNIVDEEESRSKNLN